MRQQAGRTYCRLLGVAEPYNLWAISRSDWRRCSHVELHRARNGLDHRRRMGGPDPRGDSSVHIGRDGSRGKAGKPARLIIMMMLPFTVGMSVVAIGAAMAIGWWRSRRRPARGND